MTTHMVRGFAIAIAAATAAAIGLVALSLVVWGDVEALFLLGPLGGAMAAIVLAATGASRTRLTVPDPFARDFASVDVVNIAHVRVAGIGGLALVVVAAVVVLQFQLLTAAYVIGIAGGICCGAALIVYRRAHQSLRPGLDFEHL